MGAAPEMTRELHGKIVRILVSDLGALADEDTIQAGMEGALRAARTWEPGKGASLANWMIRRAKGAALDHLRSERRHSGVSRHRRLALVEHIEDDQDGESPTLQLADDRPGPQELRDESAHMHLQQLIDALPHDQGRVLRWMAGGYTIAEIAELEGVSEDGVYYRARQARAGLQRLIEQDDSEDLAATG